MPWHLVKSGSGYLVVDDDGKKYSAKPLPKRRAAAQLRALYASGAKEVGLKHLPGKHDQSTHSPTGRAAQEKPAGEKRSPKETMAEGEEPLEAQFEPSKWDAMDIPTRKGEWAKLDLAEQDRQADAKRNVLKNQAELLKDLGERPAFEAGKVRDSIARRIDSAKDTLPEASAKEISIMTTGLDQLLEIQGVSEETRYKLGMEATDVLIAQEVESLGRVLGDHGMAHIGGNLNFATEILQQHPAADDTAALAGTAIATIFHDSGYLTDPSRAFLDEGHPRWSKEHYEANIKPLVEEALGADMAGKVGDMIGSHAETKIDFDGDIYGTSLRLADNLALFQKEKLPGLLRHVPENKGVLEDLASNKIDFPTAQKLVKENVNKSPVSPKVKDHLLRAANELTPMTPKLTLGMFAGEVVRFVWAGDHLAVYMRRQPDFDLLQKMLDLGQKQFDKLIKTYKSSYSPDENLFADNVLDFTQNGKSVLTINVIGESEKELKPAMGRLKFPFWRLKHLPGGHDQRTHAPNKGGAEGSDSSDRPAHLVPEEAPAHITNPTRRWQYSMLAKKVNKYNQAIHDLTNEYREKKDTATWGVLSKIKKQIDDLIEERAPFITDMESQSQMKLGFGIHIPVKPVTPGAGETPVGQPGQTLPLFKGEWSNMPHELKLIYALKHLPGGHPQERHGWRYGGGSSGTSFSKMKRIARQQGGAEWQEFKKRFSGRGDLPQELHQAQRAVSSRLEKIEKIKDPKERIQALNELEGAIERHDSKTGHIMEGSTRKIAGMRAGAKRELAKTQTETTGAKGPTKYGQKTSAFGADPNQSYEMKYRVMSLDDAIASNNAGGDVNPDYLAELQPRKRERAASEQQVETIARELNPEALLTDFHTLDKGPMIVGDDNMVEAGNGRILALRRAKEQYPDNWEAYQSSLKDHLDEAGLTPKDIEGIKNPILVRERVDKTVDRAEFARESNKRPGLDMSPLELAIEDTPRITDSMVDALSVGEEQDLDKALRSPGNKNFVNKFVDSLDVNERASILREDGSLNRMGLFRIKAAIFAKVFPGEAGQRISDAFLESLDSGIKNFESALSAALPQVAKAESLVRAGRRRKDLSLAKDFAKALDMLARLRDNGISVADYLAQGSLWKGELNSEQRGLLAYFDGMGRSPRGLKDFFRKYASLITNSPATGQATFMNVELTREGLLKQLLPEQPLSVEIPSVVPAGQGAML